MKFLMRIGLIHWALAFVILVYTATGVGAFFWSSLAERALEAMFNGTTGTSGSGNRFLDSSGNLLLRSKRAAGCSTGAAAGNTCTTTVTWNTAFADTNYTAVCGCNTATQIPVLSFTKAAGALTVTTTTAIAAVSSCGTIECTAQHD